MIERGKLAVVVGVESSDLFGCSEPAGCDRADVDHGLTRMRRLGVSTLFIAHWVDNAFAGSALEGGTKGVFINIFNQVETGHYFNTGPCPDPSQGEEVNTIGPVETQILGQFFPAAAGIPPMPDYPEGKQCNTKGLTKLGAYLVRRMIDAGMLIEVDHMSELARDRVLEIAAQHHYPVVSGHTGTGGSWTPKELRTLYRNGGLGSATPDAAPDLARKLLGFRAYRSPRHYFGVGLGTDTGGFSSLPGPPDDAAQNPLAYPFKSYDGKMTFTRQHSGDRFFDLNTDGVAHYGLFADLLAEMQRGPDGPAAMKTAVPLRGGLPADVGAGPRAALGGGDLRGRALARCDRALQITLIGERRVLAGEVDRALGLADVAVVARVLARQVGGVRAARPRVGDPAVGPRPAAEAAADAARAPWHRPGRGW